MKITLSRIGGLMPMTKKSETDVDWSEAEMEELVNTVKTGAKTGESRDSTSYYIEYNGSRTKIDWEKIPSEHSRVFEKMKDDLQIVKG